MRSWRRWKTEWTVLLLVLLLFLSHLPFLTPDPDLHISFSRGPFTDEGLNTIQVRNLINHGDLAPGECDNLLKTPLFAATTGIPMAIFGTTQTVARLTVLLLVILMLIMLSRKSPFTGIFLVLIPITFFKYQVFHFTHFSLAEMPAVASIFAGIFFLHRSYQPFRPVKKPWQDAVLAAIFLSMAWWFKIQFIYIFPLAIMVAADRAYFRGNLSRRQKLNNGMALSAVTVFILLLYMMAWYLPFKGTYDYMMAHQSGTLSLDGRTWELIRFNVEHFLLSAMNRAYVAVFVISVALGGILLYRKPSAHFPVLFKSSLFWFVLEAHKLTMEYGPTRYQVSFYAAMGLLMAVVLLEIHRTPFIFAGNRISKLLHKSFVVGAILVIFFQNASEYLDSLERRTYVIRHANSYLARHLAPEDVVIGAWAPSLTWESGSRALPVWGGFLNDDDPVKRFKPRVVISEPDEQDSEQAYRNQGIDLAAVSDSVKAFRIGDWEIYLYWIK